KKQKNITLSSTESEMNALSNGEQENQWLTFLIKELWKLKLEPTLNFGSNLKTKHLDIKIENLRGKFSKNEVYVKLIPSGDMISYSLNKAAPHSSFRKLQDRCLSVISSSKMGGC
ncbi:hypothetical protein VP01_11093g1, partial [Puccinia sorghi]